MIDYSSFHKNPNVLKFFLGGIGNTALTYLVYLLLNTFLDYKLAYFIAYFLGIIMAYFINSMAVFQVNLSWKKFIIYPLIYITQYILAALLLKFLVEVIGLSTLWAPLVVTMGIFPLTYLMNKIILH